MCIMRRGSVRNVLACDDVGSIAARLPLGSYYKTDAAKETSVQGVFARGDVATPMPGIAFAVADGVRAGRRPSR